MTSTDAYVVEKLLEWVDKVISIQDRDGWEVWRTVKTVSGLLNQKIELHTGFGALRVNVKAIFAAIEQFRKLKPSILMIRRGDFTAELVGLIKDDPSVSEAEAYNLLQVVDQEPEEVFWATTFISAISSPNIKCEDPALEQAGVLLAARNGDVWPLCRKERLFKNVKGQCKPLSEIVTFPLSNDRAEQGQEAVCASCAKLLPGDSALFFDDTLIAELRRHHQEVQESAVFQESMLDTQLNAEVSSIINNLGDRFANGEIPKEVEPEVLSIKKPIRAEYYTLGSRVRDMSKKIDFDLQVAMSYKTLWKLLVDKELIKQDLKEQAKLSSITMGRLNAGDNVTTDVLLRICQALECQLSDIAEVIPLEEAS